MGKTIGLIVCISLLFLLPAVVFSITSFVIAGQNINSSCDVGENSIMRLSTWLFVNGSVSLGLLIIYATLLVLFLFLENYCFLILFIIFYIINWLFLIGWNVTGAVQLFEHSNDCQTKANALWVMTLVALIFQWFSILQLSCSRRLLITIGEQA